MTGTATANGSPAKAIKGTKTMSGAPGVTGASAKNTRLDIHRRGEWLVAVLPDLSELCPPDLHEAGRRLLAEITAAVSAPAPGAAKAVALDFAALGCLTSAVLGLMAEVRKQVYSAGGRLAIVGMSPKLMPVFRLSRLDRLFRFCATIDEAVG
jgi:anti-anti-sigma factor